MDEQINRRTTAFIVEPQYAAELESFLHNNTDVEEWHQVQTRVAQNQVGLSRLYVAVCFEDCTTLVERKWNKRIKALRKAAA